MYEDTQSGPVSPTQTQSPVNSTPESASYTSSSSPGPSTPPLKFRPRMRDNELGRVPLHRRGMSKTYETLADVLAAEGYAETHIATPEKDTTSDRALERQSGMGAVVEFLSQIFPNSRSSEPEETQDTYYSPPPTTSPSTDDCDREEATPRASRYDSLASERLLKSYEKFGAPPDLPSSSSRALAHPRPSRAGELLRHVNSSASMGLPSRPRSTPAHLRPQAPSVSIRNTRPWGTSDEDDDVFTQKGNGEGEEEDRFHFSNQPPLPQTWLETVARALLSGGHAGGPIDPVPKRQHRPPHPLRKAESTVSCSSMKTKVPTPHRRGLTDQTNSPLPPSMGPPTLFTMLERGRAGRSESQVTRTKVVCRSAPGSRASSLTRNRRQGEKGRGRRRATRRGTDDDDRVPSLARTQTEDDEWNNGKGRPSTANDVKAWYTAGTTPSSLSRGDESLDYEDENDDDDHEGELDLARILVHPKRQLSIQSLRKHLHTSASASTIGGRANRTRKTVRSPLHDDDDWPEEYGAGWTKRIVDNEDEEAEAYERYINGQRTGHDRGAVAGVWGKR